MMDNLGRLLLMIGVAVIALGGLLMLLSRIPFFRNLGNLPGDVRMTAGNVSCFFPIATSIVLSLLLTVILNILIRVINR